MGYCWSELSSVFIVFMQCSPLESVRSNFGPTGFSPNLLNQPGGLTVTWTLEQGPGKYSGMSCQVRQAGAPLHGTCH